MSPTQNKPGRSRGLLRAAAASAALAALFFFEPAGFSAGGRHFLWEAKSDTATVYLLGSIHVATDRLYPLDDVIEDAYRNSDNLVVEVDLDKASPERTQVIMMQRGVYGDGRTLETELPADVYALAAERFKNAGMPIGMFSKFKPWFAALTLTSLEIEKLGFDPQFGIDRHFLDLARGKKPVLELESFEEQIALIDGLSDIDQERFLVYTMDDIDNLSADLNRLFRAWRGGDEKAVEEILNQSVAGRPELAGMVRSFIDERNNRMLRKINGYLDGNGSYFVVVGAGHLVGHDGLIEQLREKGYAVRQL
jgi:uncharacterized protein YbaP (TraB family)